LIALFKKEKPVDPGEVPEGCYETYKQVVEIFKLRPVQILTGILLTCRIAFAPSDAVSGFKMQEYGMPKADIATISPLLLIIGLVLPALVGHTVSNRPLDVFMIGLPLKLVTSILGWVAVQTTSWAYQDGGDPGITFFGPLIVILVLNEIAGGLLFVSFMSFFAKISDPAIGGTYMTLLNTITNLGSKWPNVTALYLLPKLTISVCRIVTPVASSVAAAAATAVAEAVKDNLRGQERSAPFVVEELADVTCNHGSAQCHAKGGKCHMQLDGYTVESAVCIAIGVIWIFIFRDAIARLQFTPSLEWMVVTGKSSNRDR
jgi:PAT family acetyl-CoA transporter-like MFS transporter 1